MTKSDPIIAVQDIKTSSAWYQTVFGFSSIHEGDHFDILVNEKEEVMLCLHPWGEHGHPTMQNRNQPAGNGLILYFRTTNLQAIRERITRAGLSVEVDIHTNPNSHHQEFSLYDPDGYYITISEYHTYNG